mmetsp:Transcript_47628/g.134177  ORF Transcript_47628/g.134177 Transcript_47628/m.134177 type:complete len:282 (+) Transcript_47628:231-1076(+)
MSVGRSIQLFNQVVRNVSIHVEHGYFGVAPHNDLEFVVANDLAFVAWILQLVLLDIIPQCRHHLWSRQDVLPHDLYHGLGKTIRWLKSCLFGLAFLFRRRFHCPLSLFRLGCRRHLLDCHLSRFLLLGRQIEWFVRMDVCRHVLVHGKHGKVVTSKDFFHLGIQYDLSSVVGILKIVRFDIIPERLDDFSTGHFASLSQKVGQLGRDFLLDAQSLARGAFLFGFGSVLFRFRFGIIIVRGIFHFINRFTELLLDVIRFGLQVSSSALLGEQLDEGFNARLL